MGSSPSYARVAPEFTDLQRINTCDRTGYSEEREQRRRKTMKAVLASLGKEAPNGVDYLMAAYTQWLLTTKSTNEESRLMNRWELMTAFVMAQPFL
jgi:hypothetical protein